MEYDENYISFFTCTMPVQNIWTKEDQRKNINKHSFLLVEEEEVLFQAELQIGRNSENEEHTSPLKFLSHGHGKCLT